MSERVLAPDWLPWDRNSNEERLFLKALSIAVGVSLLLGGVIPLIHVPEPKRADVEAIPPRLARMVMERQKPPPPPKVESRGEEKAAEQPQPVATETPMDPRVAAARSKAARSGVLAMSKELSALSSVGVLDKVTSRAAVSSGGSQLVRGEATMVSNATQGSGGIDTATLVQEKPAPQPAVDRVTTQLALSSEEEATVAKRVSLDESGKGATMKAPPKRVAARDQDLVSETLDRNKGAVYAIYNRALRQNALLAGNVIFAITIEPSGKVSSCKVLSSELRDEELERKLAARIAMIDFPREAVPQVTMKWPLTFLPN